MGEFPNKATQFKSGKRAVELGRKGGLKGGPVRNDKRKLAQQFRYMKQKGITKETLFRSIMFCEERGMANAFLIKQLEDLQAYIIKTRGYLDLDDQKLLYEAYSRLYDKFHKNSPQININTQNNTQNNIVVLEDDKKELIKRLVGEEEE